MQQPKVVLVVEDDPLMRALFVDLVEDDNIDVVGAADALEALTLLDQHAVNFGAVITDVSMPGTCDGVGLAQRIRYL